MATMTLRDDLADRVSKLASERRVPVDQQLDQLVERALPLTAEAVLSRRDAFGRIAAMTPRAVPQTDGVLLLREDRDR